MKKILIALICTLSGHLVFSQNLSTEDLFHKNGEIYFRFELNSIKEIYDLTKVISIDNVDGLNVFAYANKKEFNTFTGFGYDFTILPHPNEKFDPKMATFDQIVNSDNWEFYPTYDAYLALMAQFETDYPGLCDIDTIGESEEGRLLLVAKISDNVDTDEAEPEFLYTSSMHGDELAGYPLMLNLIDSLLSNYGSVLRITNLVDNIEIYINPLANPDGTYAGGDNTVGGATRNNSNYVDLNRNYPDPDDGPNPDGNPWQAETISFMNFAEDRNFVMAANFHGGAEVINYPWDTWSFLTADDNWWQYVSHEYADTCQEYSPSGYMSGFDDGITNGYQWYPVAGGRQDYMNYYHHCREVTMEISNTKLIPESQIAAHWEYNRRSLLNYMEQVLFGISGLVTDATTGLPVEAEVYVLNHESENSWVYSEPETGNYHRLLYSGTYDVQFSAPCHETLVVNNVAVSNKTTTVLDVQLNPLQATVDFTTASTTAGTGDVIIFSDLSCGTVLNWDWQISGPGPANFINGTTSGTQNPEVQFDTPGLYTVSLTITTPSGDLTETKTDYITILECIYCPSSAADPTEEWISNVSFNTINNSTGGENGYENYTSISTDVEIENTYGLSVNIESTGSWVEHCVAYIDWNRNCDFSDAGEAIYLGSNQGSGFLFQNITIPDNATPGITRLRISLRWSNIPGPCDQFNYGEVEDYSLVILEPEIELDLKVFLEGPFDNPVMATVLNDNGHLPLSQPYTAFPWNYQGTENTTSIPLAAVDWILVEIHDASDAGSVDASTMVDQKAGFVLSDGSVVDIEGTSNVIFNHLMDNQLYVVLRHRNHLDILSSTAISEQAGLYVYDFTTSADKVYGGAAGYKEFTSGLWGMVSGDADANGIINSLDKSSHWITEAGKMGYLISDLNLDGQSENRDKNDSWQANNGMTGFPLAK